jgi:hypothetical protein
MDKKPEFKCVESHPKFSILNVYELPEADPNYSHILFQLPGGFEQRISHTDAQKLGHALNRAGGGVL